MRQTVLGVDPGETTGLAVVQFEAGQARVLWQDQKAWQDAAEWLRCKAVEHEAGAVDFTLAVERFMISPKTAQRGQDEAVATIGMMGVCRFLAARHGVEAVYESASAAKKAVDDTSLRNLGLWARGRKHANDATRQTVLLAVKRRWLPAGTML